GSETDTPENKDISFFADINLNTGHIKVRRVPSSPRIRDVLADPTNNTDIPLPKEIRRETGLTVVQITPVKPEGKSFGVLDTPKNDIAVSSIPVVGAIPLSRDTSEIQTSGLRETSTSLIRTTAETMPVSVSRPSSEKETVQEEADSLWDDIPALLTAARLLKQPVDGKALVHIARFDSVGIALTDGPVILRLRGKNLPTGWVVISGHFTYTPMQNANDAVGFVDVQSFTAMSHKGEK
ncbi:MAG: hypothetical protein SPL08_02610, partial [Pseudomonadota bacterium]|nr:hypothetical protein [Pseudomonadota bacterium]